MISIVVASLFGFGMGWMFCELFHKAKEKL